MATTNITDVAAQVQAAWSNLFIEELRADTLLPGLVNRDYDGEIKQGGDNVTVSQIVKATGETRTVGVDADAFAAEKMVTKSVKVSADKRFVSSFKFEDLVQLQSQIGQKDSEIRKALLAGVEAQMNDYLYSLAIPSGAAPDHTISGGGNFQASVLRTVRQLAAQAKWTKTKPWYLLAAPTYYTDMLADTTLASTLYSGETAPTVAGQMALRRYGFNILEDNSRPDDYALAFHPDFLLFVMQRAATFKVSDLHPLGQFGYLISVDILGGAKLGISGDVKCIEISG